MLTPRTTRGNWRKKKKRSPARNRSRFMRTIVPSTITSAIVPLIAEIDGDVIERRDLGLATPNQPTPVYTARRMNTKKLHEATAKRTLGSTSVSRELVPCSLSRGPTQFWDSVGLCGVLSGVGALICSKLLSCHRKMMPCSGTS